MNLKNYESFLTRDQSNAVYRANKALDAIQDWQLPRNLLDVGCGSGELLRLATDRGMGNVFGVDGVQDALRQSQDAPGEIHIVDLNASGLPFPDDKFDAVTCLEVLEHLYAPQQTLAEIARVTRPGGRVLLSVPNPFGYAARLRLLSGHNISDPATIGGHIKFFKREDLQKMCISCGLNVIRVWGAPYPTAHRKYGPLADFMVQRWPDLFATWFFAFCEKCEAGT